jgi:steroid delta-isomerase-like uncharacterized protein
MRGIVVLPLMAIFVLLNGCTLERNSDTNSGKAVVERFIEISNNGNWDQLAEVVAADFKRHSAATAGEPVRSLAEFITLQQGFMTTFPDQHVRLDHMIAEGNHVAIRAVYTGTQVGPMGDIPATGNSMEAPFIAFFRVESGKITELWLEWDNLGILTQLGVFPPTAPAND